MTTAEQVWQDIQEIVSIPAKEYRVKLDTNIHCMDVGIAALKASDPTITYSEKEKLHRLFRREFFTSNSLEESIANARERQSVDLCMFVEDPKWGDYIIAPSYGTLRARLTRALKVKETTNKFTHTGDTTSTNIGHLSLKSSTAATTPLEAKLVAIIGALGTTPIASTFVKRNLAKLQKEHKLSTSYVFNRKSFDLDKFNEILGTATVLVTLQTSDKNKSLAKVEAKVEREVSKYLTSPKFQQAILNQKGSNSVLEDIQEALVASLTGKKLSKNTKHTKKPTKTSTMGLGLGNISTSSFPRIRDFNTGRFISLSGLLPLLNYHLQDVISANMGGGSRRDILNYRTGRFAASAKVERLTQSKEGMVTAFYSYMRNPYGTFSEGGKQQYPKSRDPKLLISKSIREIAAQAAVTRMRAVLV